MKTMNPTAHPLSDRQLLKTLRYVLRRNGTRVHELEDTVSEIIVLTLEYLVGKAPPADLKEWTALVCRIARNRAVSELRKRKRREKNGDAGLTDQEDEAEPLGEDEGARDALDQKTLMGVLEEQFREGEMPSDGEAILDAVAAGENQEEIAEELGLTHGAVRKRLCRIRETFADRLEKEGMSHLKRAKR